jgi:hypothetical protein
MPPLIHPQPPLRPPDIDEQEHLYGDHDMAIIEQMSSTQLNKRYHCVNPFDKSGNLKFPLVESGFFKSYEPGQLCGICQDTLSNGESICVNRNKECHDGFHCDCIFDYQRVTRDYHCPICSRAFLKTELPRNQQNVILNTSFGKKKQLNQNKKDIVYLKRR